MITNDFLPCKYLRLVEKNRDLKATLLNIQDCILPTIVLKPDKEIFVLKGNQTLCKTSARGETKYTITYWLA